MIRQSAQGRCRQGEGVHPSPLRAEGQAAARLLLDEDTTVGLLACRRFLGTLDLLY